MFVVICSYVLLCNCGLKKNTSKSLTEESGLFISLDTNDIEQGRSIYEMNCVGCHDLTYNLVGPPLGNVISKYEGDLEWIAKFIWNSSALIDDGDERAVAIFKSYGEMKMYGYITHIDTFSMSQLLSYLYTLDGPLETIKIAESLPASMTALKSSMQHGERIFALNCSVCHGEGGKGSVAPNLTDQEWIHGGELEDIRRIIVEGVPHKGMVSWETQLNEYEINDLVVYVKSLSNEN